MYSDDAVFRSAPFREPHLGREGALEYARSAFADQDDFTDCWFGEPVVAGDRAAVEYWAVLVENGRPVTIAGVAVLRFGAGRPRPLPARLLGARARGPRADARVGHLTRRPAGATLFA